MMAKVVVVAKSPLCPLSCLISRQRREHRRLRGVA